MKIDIAKTTDTEIQDIIDVLVKNGFTQIDKGYVEVSTPFKLTFLGNNKWKTEIEMALYPELLSYYKKSEWVVVPWICLCIELEDDEYAISTLKQHQVVRWLCTLIISIGLNPFKDEDAFDGYFSRNQRKGYVKLKMYINPSYPEGYWSNHTL